MVIFHMQHRKYPGNSTKLKEEWGRKDHLLSWVLLLELVWGWPARDLKDTHKTPWESAIIHCLFYSVDSRKVWEITFRLFYVNYISIF